MKTQGVKQKSERGSKEGNFSAGFLKFLGGSGFRGFVQQGVGFRQELRNELRTKPKSYESAQQI